MNKPLKNIVIYGPSGCGKTTYTEALRKKYKMSYVLDKGGASTRREVLTKDTLILLQTGAVRPWMRKTEALILIPFSEAIKDLKEQPNG